MVHHRHSLVLVGAGHLPGSLNHRFLAASGIVPADGGWVPAQEGLGPERAEIRYHNRFWLEVLPARATFCQEASPPGSDPRMQDLIGLAEIAEGYHEAFPRIAHQAVELKVDLMLDADPRRLLPGLLVAPSRWILGDAQPFGMRMTHHYPLPDGVLDISLCHAKINRPAQGQPQPQVALSANAEIVLPDGLSRAGLRRLLERLPVYREMALTLADQLSG